MFPRTTRIYLAIVGSGLAAAFVVAVTAAATGVQLTPFGATAALAAAAAKPSPSPSPGTAAGNRQAACDRFIGHLASNLGKKPDQVNKALADALNQSLADAVKAGNLTQQQADAIKAKESGKQVCSGDLAAIGAAGRGPARAGARVTLAEYAKVLGMNEQDLRQALASGKTLKDLATAKGMDQNGFRTSLVQVVKADLDSRVSAGKLTQQQEDAILSKLQNNPIPLWDKPIKRTRAPAPTASPTANG